VFISVIVNLTFNGLLWWKSSFREKESGRKRDLLIRSGLFWSNDPLSLAKECLLSSYLLLIIFDDRLEDQYLSFHLALRVFQICERKYRELRTAVNSTSDLWTIRSSFSFIELHFWREEFFREIGRNIDYWLLDGNSWQVDSIIAHTPSLRTNSLWQTSKNYFSCKLFWKRYPSFSKIDTKYE